MKITQLLLTFLLFTSCAEITYKPNKVKIDVISKELGDPASTFKKHYNLKQFEKITSLIQSDKLDKKLAENWISSLFEECGKIQSLKKHNEFVLGVRKYFPEKYDKRSTGLKYAVVYSDGTKGYISFYTLGNKGDLVQIGFVFGATRDGQKTLGCIWAKTEAKMPSLSQNRLWFKGKTFAHNSQYFFPGILNPPLCHVVLPKDFIIDRGKRPFSQKIKPNLGDGVIWSRQRTVRIFRDGKEFDTKKVKDPLFYARLSTKVAQIPGEAKFTIEKITIAQLEQAGFKDIEMNRYDWSGYPVFELKVTKPNGLIVRKAWIGLNTPQGWCIQVELYLPMGEEGEGEKDKLIWKNFLKMSGKKQKTTKQ